MRVSENIRGALFMMASMVTYTVNDAFMKGLLAHVPLFQATFLRGIGTVAFLFVFALMLGQLRAGVSRRDWQLIGLRSLAEAAAAYFFLTAIANMPLANASAILQSLPLTVTLAAAVFLREPIGWRRMSAISVGFIGVILIVQPGGDGFSAYSLYAIATVLCVTLRDLVVRRMSPNVPSGIVALATAVVVTVFFGFGSVSETWAPITDVVALYLMGAVVFLVLGYIFSVSAMRIGDVGFVAPFRYVSLLAALILGAVFFAEWPNGLALCGAGIVVVTGVFTLLRGQAQKSR